jgi:predicted nucleic acid-binding protein
LLRGLDTNILCYALDPAFPENRECKRILLEASAESELAINPTVLHETYHTLVFDQKWVPSEARQRLVILLQHPHLEFYSQTKRVSLIALDLAARNRLGGRDSLILANYLAGKVPVFLTHDHGLLELAKVSWRGSTVEMQDPLE